MGLVYKLDGEELEKVVSLKKSLLLNKNKNN